LRLSDSYDIPEEVARGPHSPAFGKFLSSWFGDTYTLTHGELDLTFLEGLTTEERELAREMVRRNLKLKYTHIIEGVSALHDTAAVPILRNMFNEESDEDRRLTIAGALWKLVKDPIFIECLERAKTRGSLGYFGLAKVLWLNDARAVDILIDVLPQRDRESAPWTLLKWLAFRPVLRPLLIRAHIAHAHGNQEGFFALSLLNRLEFGGPSKAVDREMWRLPSDYRRRRHEVAFRESMTAAVHKWNLEVKNGR
jgi:hypothetical protein